VYVIVVWVRVVAGRHWHRTVVGDGAIMEDHCPGDQRLERTQLVGDEQDRAAASHECP